MVRSRCNLPDVIESISATSGPSATIKSHTMLVVYQKK